MEFSDHEKKLLESTKETLTERTKAIAKNPEAARERGIKDPDMTAVNFLHGLDLLGENFENLETTNKDILKVFLVVLNNSIPEGMEAQDEFDKHMALIGKLAVMQKQQKFS